MMDKFKVHTTHRCELVDITRYIQKIVSDNKVKEGIVHVFIPHTTCAVTVNENCDPSVQSDISDTLKKLIPHDAEYAHNEGNSDAHIKASMVGSGRTIFVVEGKIAFGTWQGVYLCEFDGPRTREVWVKVISD